MVRTSNAAIDLQMIFSPRFMFIPNALVKVELTASMSNGRSDVR